MNWELMMLQFVALIISLTFHEAAHAWIAKLGGDLTAYRSGQVTINPIPHMQREPFGMVVLPLLTLYMSKGTYCFGFAHAPYDAYWAARNPRKSALMSLAGPTANLLLAAVAFGVMWAVGRVENETEDTIRRIANTFLFLNLLLGIFNLVPLPPLDGAGVVRGLWPRTGRFYDTIQNIPYSTIVVIVLISYYLGDIFYPVYFTVRGWLPFPTG